MVQESLNINSDDVLITVVMTDYIDQDQNDTEIKYKSNKAVSFAETIAAKFDNQHTKNKKSSVINPPVTKFSSMVEFYKPTNTTKRLSVIKPLKIKLSSIANHIYKLGASAN
ncbi:6226_t:CDS:2 [Cetraspora pellucida]|uniref:6226_t:CDS:1 n=1 Tax=Cetraspora pellucida TaxID=1433469 RepID=A0ACA9NSM3_9GLOM|nr:6226_t:CDS:2 [Cetraspora pellucida]